MGGSICGRSGGRLEMTLTGGYRLSMEKRGVGEGGARARSQLGQKVSGSAQLGCPTFLFFFFKQLPFYFLFSINLFHKIHKNMAKIKTR
jgi:hypothetical protein